MKFCSKAKVVTTYKFYNFVIEISFFIRKFVTKHKIKTPNNVQVNDNIMGSIIIE